LAGIFVSGAVTSLIRGGILARLPQVRKSFLRCAMRARRRV
jgi:hypothetical protein